MTPALKTKRELIKSIELGDLVCMVTNRDVPMVVVMYDTWNYDDEELDVKAGDVSSMEVMWLDKDNRAQSTELPPAALTLYEEGF